MKIALISLIASTALVVTAIRLLGIELGRERPGAPMPRLLKAVLVFSVLAAIALIAALRWTANFLESVLS